MQLGGNLLHVRVGLPRARLSVGKQAGVKSFKGPQQQRFGQSLVHRLLAGKVVIRLVHRAKGEIVGERVALLGVGVLNHSLLTVHGDDLHCFLRLLPRKRRFC